MPGRLLQIVWEQIAEKVDEKTLLVSVMHVNSETGTIQPVKEIGNFLADKNILFHVDATQSYGKMNDELKRVKYDLLSCSAHKLRGPQGIGLLVKKMRKPLSNAIAPVMYGGGQEYGIRPGTLPVALIGGFGKAVELCEKNKIMRKHRCEKIRERLLSAITEVRYEINGSLEYCVPNTLNISFTDVDAEGIFVSLKNDYAFSNGAACTSGSYSSSYVLKAMGLEQKRIDEAVRISWDYDTEVDFKNLIEYVKGMQAS